MSVEIESGIPIPAKASGSRIGQEKYPWSKLEVGQSFFVADGKIASFTSNVAGKNRKQPEGGTRFRAVAVEKDGVQGVRVFRVQ